MAEENASTPGLVTTCAVLHIAGPDPDSQHGRCMGHCPCCHQAVFEDQDPVWTCPANLNEDNPHWSEPMFEVTEAMMTKAGVYSSCGLDWARGCHEDMPLHGDCYGLGTY